MKFLVVIPTYYPKLDKGGPIIALYNQLFYLSKKYYLEIVTSQNLSKLEKLILKTNINLNYSVNNSNIFQFFFKIKKFDIVYINSIFSFHSIKFIFLSRVYNKKVFISPRGSVNQISLKKRKLEKLFIILLIKKLLKKENTKFIATSDLEKNEIIKFFKKYKVEVLPNGLNTLNLYYPLKNKESEILQFIDNHTILYFSRIDKKKNLDKLINIIDKHKLLIVGDYSDKDYFNSLDLSNKNIKYVGPIYSKDLIKKIFSKVAFLCLPSNFENFANCVLDSIYYGCPVLLSQNIGLVDLVNKFKLGHIFKDNIKYKDLEYMFNNLNYFRKNIDENKQDVLKNYSWNEVNNKFINMVK